MFKYILYFLLLFAALPSGVNEVYAQKPGGKVVGPKSKAKPKPRTKPNAKPQSRSASAPQRTSRLTYDASTHTLRYGSYRYQMVYVAGGTFTMGATSEQGEDAEDDEKPTHSVTLSSYYMGQTEVPQWLWKAVMGSNPSYNKGDNLPVENVSYDDCKTFISRLNNQVGANFLLPSEAQWEYAARGGVRSRGYKYSGSNYLEAVAWYSGNSNIRTHAVGRKQSNELGLYDMSGNVCEWCSDWYDSYPSFAVTDPLGPSSGSSRVYRGGSYSYYAGYCRVSSRYSYAPGYGDYGLGLRLAILF